MVKRFVFRWTVISAFGAVVFLVFPLDFVVELIGTAVEGVVFRTGNRLLEKRSSDLLEDVSNVGSELCKTGDSV